MMDPFTIGFGVASALGTAGEFAGRLLGAGARQTEIRQRMEAIQQKREHTLSTTLARGAASGIVIDPNVQDSFNVYLSGIAQQFDKELAMLRDYGRTTELADYLGAGAGLLGGAANFALGMKKLT